MAVLMWRLQMLRWHWSVFAWNVAMVSGIVGRHARLCWRWWHLPTVFLLAVSEVIPTLEAAAGDDDG